MERKMVDEKHQLKRNRSSELSEENREQIKRGKQPVKEKERPSTAWDFDVFISFRGKDTRKGFTSHLHERLKIHGITAFIDSENLKKGKKISDLITHIEGSKIFLPVFSENYADSKWCLREIAKMVEINRREGEKRPVIPVFYDVDPSAVKHPTDPKSSFRNAFEKHQGNEKLSKEQINEWSTALTKAGNISGFCPSDTEGNEAKLITLIIKDVSNILCKVPFDIQPIGIGPRINTLKQMLGKEKEGVCMIGICGLGGIGKTTLAMALYNYVSFVFEGSCFLSDIRDNEKNLHSLQAKLLQKVLGENIPFDKVEEGVNLIRQRFRSKKILLILDDVDHIRQLEAFTGKLGEKVQWFGAGSKIIVTTRDMKVLTRHGLQQEDIYFPEGLDVRHSLKLFCHHAFHRDQPSAALGELPLQVVKVAQGLPLALKVFGSLFWDLKEKEEWEEMLEKLKCDQHKEVHERLKVSYDSLEQSEKSVFLDIACFFIGKKKEYPVYMWGACGYFPRLSLKVLQHKSLIKINKWDQFEMHDQIRDMGRMIMKEGKSDPLKYSRPWSKDQTSEVLRDAKVSLGNPHVQGIQLEEKIEMRVIEGMPELRMIIGAYGSHCGFEDEEETIRLPSNIRWLQWIHCPYQTLTFHNDKHEQLCVLDLSGGQFRDFRSHRMDFRKLKVLNLSYCKGLIQTPDFTHLDSLEKLSLDYCLSLTRMDESIEKLEKLVELSLYTCKNLEGLPAGLCKLSSLEYLDLRECTGISVLPTQLGNLRSLKYLYLQCSSISDVPNSIGSLQSLETLDLGACEGISTLPEEIGHLTSLKYLDLERTSISDVPDSIGRLQSLENLNLAQCKGISTLPKQIGNLTSLKYLYLGWTSMSNVPDSIRSLKSLKVLRLHKCKGISTLPKQIGDLTSLKELDLTRTSISDVPDSIRSLQSLKKLNLDGCKGISILPKQIGDLTSLKELRLRGTSISALPDSIGSLQSIEELDLSNCTFLQKIPDSIGDLKSLSLLSLTKCELLEQLPNSMGMLTSLKRLDIDNCKLLREVPDSLGDLNNGFEIHVEGCILLEKLPNNIRIVGEKTLHKFQFDGLKSLRRLPDSLGGGVVVHQLSLRDCASLKELPDSIGMRMVLLVELDLSGCTLLGKISESIGNLKHLRHLILKHCKSLEELPECTGKLLSLKELDLSGCILLGRVPESIGYLKSLNCLTLSGCQSLEELPECIGRLLSLEKLNLSGCILLGRIPESIGNLKGLNLLTLSGCRSLEELPEGIGRLLSLKQLDLSGCTSTKSIPESLKDLKELYHLTLHSGISDSIGMLTSLRGLYLSGCSPSNCRSLKKLLESMEGLKYLRTLDICGGMSINMFPDFLGWQMKYKEKLELCELEEIPEPIGGFPPMEVVAIKDCPKLESLPQLPSSLTFLLIQGCAAFRKLSDPSTLDCLQILILAGCKAFTDLSGIGSLKSLKSLALFDQDGLSRDLMDKLSQVSFEELEMLFICGARDGSDLLFGLPKSNVGQVQGLEGMYCLTEKLPSDTSDINICIQVLVEEKIATEVTCIQTIEEDQGDNTDDDYGYDDDTEDDDAEEFGKWVLGDQDIYEINSEEGKKEIVKWVGEGNTTLRIPTTYNHYRLRMAFLEVAYLGLPKNLPTWMALLPD